MAYAKNFGKQLTDEERLVAWAAYETLAIPILNYNLGGHTPEEAEELVRQGNARWELGPCLTLTLVDAPTQGGTEAFEAS